MGVGTRGGLAALVVACAGSCSLALPLDGLSGGSAPGGPDAAQDVLTSDGDAGDAGDATTSTDAGGDAEAGDAGVQETSDAPSNAYRTAVLTDSPLAYWRLGEASGAVCHDETGNGNDATIVGNVTLGVPGALTGDPDTAAHFPGSGGLLDVGDRFDFAGTAPLTFEMWCKPDVIDTSYRHLETKMKYDDAGRPFDGTYLFVHAGTTLGYERWSDGGTDLGMSSPLVTVGSYWHVVATYDGSTANLYVNGALAQSAPTAVALVANGVHLAWGELYQGSLDELAVYDHALTLQRVLAHYQAATQ
ncbi:MAG TPA: LamG domain-containing protein [Polyangiaceae bacterium]|jgi:hypothetical protein